MGFVLAMSGVIRCLPGVVWKPGWRLGEPPVERVDAAGPRRSSGTDRLGTRERIARTRCTRRCRSSPPATREAGRRRSIHNPGATPAHREYPNDRASRWAAVRRTSSSSDLRHEGLLCLTGWRRTDALSEDLRGTAVAVRLPGQAAARIVGGTAVGLLGGSWLCSFWFLGHGRGPGRGVRLCLGFAGTVTMCGPCPYWTGRTSSCAQCRADHLFDARPRRR